MEAEWKNRKARRAGRGEVEALYTMQDAEDVPSILKVAYGQVFKLNDNLTLRFYGCGTFAGFCLIEIWATEGASKKNCISGDIGGKNKPLIRDPQYITEWIMLL